MAPRSDMQVHTQDVLPSTPRPFLTDLGSQELSSRAKGMEEMCGGGSAFPCDCGATPYGPKLRDYCPSVRNSKKRLSRRLGQGVCRMQGKGSSFGEEEAATWRAFASLYLEGTGSHIQWETSRSAQKTKVPEARPCIFPSLCDPYKDIPR